MKRAIFLDRDGVIVKDKGYVHRIEDLEIIDGAAEAIKNFNKAGFLVIVISNQSGIARGLYKELDLELFNKEMIKRLKVHGAIIDSVYFCPHHPNEAKLENYKKICECRKPAPGMILKSAQEKNIVLHCSWMIGDCKSDIEAGKKAGCRTIFIGEDVKNLKEASEMILREDKIKSREEVTEIVDGVKKKNKKIVFTNGCFDILHAGHVYYLKEAKKLGDVLIVGLNSDDSVKEVKEKTRPINSEFDRAYVLTALDCVDYVTIFNEANPIEILKKIKPHIHVKGGDWEGKEIPEKETVEKNGGRIEFIEYINGYSTTGIIEKIKKG